ncbi:MAG TPA: hypothetical protein ENN90_02885 [Mariniphaga anaerophila]|uniref:Photosynthesis system II assembly factor Ycf48/Hcf136-like domain-containing protein n=1 Tax=Mariniphaga anaerophila TaxID=1484053 RepID=A0A831PIC7_9BACT|nr:hypothetical protein [Mariniphaga anaerophila]
MKRILFFILSILVFTACEQFPTLGTQILRQFNFQIIGTGQSAEAGNYLPDSVGILMDFESLVPAGERQFIMEIKVWQGGGTVDQTLVYANKSGKMKTRWKVGDASNEQTLKVKIYDTEGLFSSENEIKATSFFSNKLNTINRGFLVGIGGMVRDTINQRSMLIPGRNLYVLTDKFYNWESINYLFNTSLKELEINSSGEVFAAGWNGNLYKTSDWGENWIDLGKPIPENPYYYEFSISKDDYLWANKAEHGIYCSKDNGVTWQKDTAGLENQERMGPVYTFADTAHMAISHSSMMIMKTTDNGLTWKPVYTPEYALTMFVTDENAIIAQNQGGFRLHKSTDGGNTYRQVFSPYVEFGTTSRHLYDKFGADYYVLAPGGGVWKTKDFEDFTELFTFTKQRNLFIDHQGNIYASGFNYSNAADDPTLILPAEN